MGTLSTAVEFLRFIPTFGKNSTSSGYPAETENTKEDPSLERQEDITGFADLREVAALRHSFHIDGRLRLEFLSVVSKLLREHEVPVTNRLLSTLIVAVPDELSDGNGHEGNGHQMRASAKKAGRRPASRKRSPPPTSAPPVPFPPDE